MITAGIKKTVPSFHKTLPLLALFTVAVDSENTFKRSPVAAAIENGIPIE
jgi:hypothetical protein